MRDYCKIFIRKHGKVNGERAKMEIVLYCILNCEGSGDQIVASTADVDKRNCARIDCSIQF